MPRTPGATGTTRPSPGDRNTAPRRGPESPIVRAKTWRLPGDGYCNRSTVLDCVYESICERSVVFDTSPQFVSILSVQPDHATQHNEANSFGDIID